MISEAFCSKESLSPGLCDGLNRIHNRRMAFEEITKKIGLDYESFYPGIGIHNFNSLVMSVTAYQNRWYLNTDEILKAVEISPMDYAYIEDLYGRSAIFTIQAERGSIVVTPNNERHKGSITPRHID